ncbi:MAG TPA: hypothetical protein VG125_32870 [Pirellulales bacterium]|jgi:hypothetical protein|nr:hypothetical protein [Pirellulales bacterium]
MSPTASTNEPNGNASEAEFLDAQAADAQAAVHQTWNELKATLRETATLEVWAKRHPWIVAGTAVAGGFLLATTVLRPQQQAENLNGRAEEDVGGPAAAQRGSNWLIDTLFGLVKPVLGQLISSLAAAAMGALSGSIAGASEQAAQGPPRAEESGLSGEGPVPI